MDNWLTLVLSRLVPATPSLLAALGGLVFAASAALKGPRRRAARLAAFGFGLLLLTSLGLAVYGAALAVLISRDVARGADLHRAMEAVNIVVGLVVAGAYVLLARAALLPDQPRTPES
jgi:hypothetical protein